MRLKVQIRRSLYRVLDRKCLDGRTLLDHIELILCSSEATPGVSSAVKGDGAGLTGANAEKLVLSIVYLTGIA